MTVSPKSEVVRARIDDAVKRDAEEILAAMGMSMSDAIRLFLHQLVVRREFPVELKAPGATTRQPPAPSAAENREPVNDLAEDQRAQ